MPLPYRPAYDLKLLHEDIARRGWNMQHIAKLAGISPSTVGLFLRGERQTAKMADKIARVMGYDVSRYLRRMEKARA